MLNQDQKIETLLAALDSIAAAIEDTSKHSGTVMDGSELYISNAIAELKKLKRCPIELPSFLKRSNDRGS